MINWREKFTAFGIHFIATLVLALVAAGLFFLVWYPDPFHEMVGGSQLFLLVIGCDLALGPLMSLVIYNSRKSRRELYMDYSLVALAQVGTLAYGMFVSFGARPAYVVFNHTRLDVVAANEFEPEDLADATLPEFGKLPWFGPQFVGARVAPSEQSDALFQGLAGKDVSLRPKFFVPYESMREEIKAAARPIGELSAKHPEVGPMLADLTGKIASTDVKWLPVKHKRGFWTALVDGETGKPIDYLPVDPY